MWKAICADALKRPRPNASMNIITYTSESKPDLTVELSESILNLKTRILSSNERTIIKRADFDISGDSVEFDTNTHTGKLVGNVKMVITSQSQLLGNQTSEQVRRNCFH